MGEIGWAPFSAGQRSIDVKQKFSYTRPMNNSAYPHDFQPPRLSFLLLAREKRGWEIFPRKSSVTN
jgi:hypothetical protein